MADGHDVLEIEAVLAGQVDQGCAAGSHVLERAWPAAAGFADASVFEAPRCETSRGQRRAQVADMEEVVLRAPESAVDDDNDGMWPGAVGQAEVAKLRRLGAVCPAKVRRGRSAIEDVALVNELAAQACLRASIPIGTIVILSEARDL